MPALKSLMLARIEAADLENLYKLESDPWIKQFVGGPVREPRLEWIEKARRIVGKDNRLKLVDRATGRFAGRVAFGALFDLKKDVEIQVLLDKDFVGNGLGSAACVLACEWAFAALDAPSVGAVVHPRHEASLKLVERLGFREVEPRYDANGSIAERIFVIDHVPGLGPRPE